jgi:uncharacterized protein
MSANPRFSHTAAKVCEQQLQVFGRATPGIMRAVLSTSDGFEVASFQTDREAAPRLSAMGSSLQALSEAMVIEAGLRSAKNVVIECETGCVLIIAVENTSPALTLAAVADSSALVGHLLWSAKACGHVISRVLQV